jgi:hypothetical protein
MPLFIAPKYPHCGYTGVIAWGSARVKCFSGSVALMQERCFKIATTIWIRLFTAAGSRFSDKQQQGGNSHCQSYRVVFAGFFLKEKKCHNGSEQNNTNIEQREYKSTVVAEILQGFE